MRRRLRFLLLVILPLAFAAAVCLVLALARCLSSFNDSVTLPNGMILARQFDLSTTERDDLLAADGRTVLARGIEFVCFDDRYVDVVPFRRGDGGLFDAPLGGAVPDAESVRRATGLRDGSGCDGYYTAMMGPGLLYGDGPPFRPSCSDRNLDRDTLADRSWFERPCDDP